LFGGGRQWGEDGEGNTHKEGEGGRIRGMFARKPGRGITLEMYMGNTQVNKKNNDYMKFLNKWMDLENIVLFEVTQSQKNTHGMYLLISGY